MSLSRFVSLNLLGCWLSAVALNAQNVPGSSASPLPLIPIVRDPQALSAISQAQASLAGTAGNVSDVTMQASVHWSVGPDDEVVSATFASAGPGTNKASFSLAAGTWAESRDQLAGTSTIAGQTQAIALHNVLNMHEWFFPQFFLKDLQETTGYSLAPPTTQTVNGQTQIEITGSLIPSGEMDSATQQVLSLATQFQLVLDGVTYLPVSLSFTLHPNSDSLNGPPVVYQFSEYQTQHGVQQPLHIQKYLQGTLTQDITIQSFALNTGITAADF